MGAVALAIQTRGEPVTLKGRRVRALVFMDVLEGDAVNLKRALTREWHLRVARDDCPVDDNNTLLLGTGDEVEARGLDLRIKQIDERVEEVRLLAR